MKMQRFEEKDRRIRDRFRAYAQASPERLHAPLNLSWSNWSFGREKLAVSARRLQRAGIPFIELHGNHYGADLGYEPKETRRILEDHGLRVSGVCGMFSADNDLASNRPVCRQNAIDYIRRQTAFTEAVGGEYLLVAPGAVGRPKPYDDFEVERSAETLAGCAHLFTAHGVKGAIEPIRAAETSMVHTVREAACYIETVGHPGVQHINGDVYHMQVGESHVGEAVLEAGERLLNLHLADSNRCALGDGSLDICTVIRALYLMGFNREGRFATFEPLGPGGDPFPAMYGNPDEAALDSLVSRSADYFRACDQLVRSEI